MGEFVHSRATQRGGLLVGLLLLSACVAPTSNLPTANPAELQIEAEKQLALSIRERDRFGQRLGQIGVPILAANTEQCGDNIRNRAGVQFHTALLNTSTINRRAAVDARGLSRPGEVKVAYTIPGLPADGVLFAGDIVTRINGVSAYAVLSGQSRVNYQLPIFRVRILRDGQQLDFRIPTVPVCNYRTILTKDEDVGAFAGQNTIIFTTGIMRLMDSDRDIALAFGHEMAHLTRNHQAAKKTNEVIGAMIAAVVSSAIGVNVVDIGANIGRNTFSQEFESEADYVGMYHASRAGWDMTGAGNLFRQMAVSNPGAIHSIGGTHPSFASRAVLVERTAVEIESKRASNLALVPNFKGLPPSQIPRAETTLAKGSPTGPGTNSALVGKSLVTPVTGSATARLMDAERQYRLGVQYEQGIDKPRDYAEAVNWYRKAAAQRHRSALFNLGMMYVDGRGVRQNNGEAVIYFRQAAELKHAKAHFNMGFMLENGRGIAKNPGQGLTSYIIASNLGLGEIADNARAKVSASLSPAQIGEAESQAGVWMDEHRR